MNLIVRPDREGLKLYRYFDGKEWQEKWEKSDDACQMVMASYIEELEPVRQKVLDGKLSPLDYHIKANTFNISILSSYTGIPKRHIKKHLKPEKFNQLDDETLQKYANAFGFSVEELKKV